MPIIDSKVDKYGSMLNTQRLIDSQSEHPIPVHHIWFVFLNLCFYFIMESSVRVPVNIFPENKHCIYILLNDMTFYCLV